MKEIRDHFYDIMYMIENLKHKNNVGKDDLQKEIIDLIDSNPDVLRERLVETGYNIGMLAAIFGLEDVVLRALEDDMAATSQSETGCNIGMYAAMYDLHNATNEALKNPCTVAQINDKGQTIIDILKEKGYDVEQPKYGEIISIEPNCKTTKKENETSRAIGKAESKINKAIDEIYNDILGM